MNPFLLLAIVAGVGYIIFGSDQERKDESSEHSRDSETDCDHGSRDGDHKPSPADSSNRNGGVETLPETPPIETAKTPTKDS